MASPGEWAAVIRGDLRRSVESILAAGGHLAEAKADVPAGDWARWLREDVGLSVPAASKLMSVARCPVLVSHAKVLPPSSETLYHLTLLPRLEDRIADGSVNPGMTRADVQALRAKAAQAAASGTGRTSTATEREPAESPPGKSAQPASEPSPGQAGSTEADPPQSQRGPQSRNRAAEPAPAPLPPAPGLIDQARQVLTLALRAAAGGLNGLADWLDEP